MLAGDVEKPHLDVSIPQMCEPVTGPSERLPMEYSTTRVVMWTKDQLASRAVAIFAQERSDERLVLITCSQWTGSYYKSNVVVFAKPLGVRERTT